ncbi:MAG: LOG family protein, partial [Parachlamydia sp.]|nr:LOG family protein [Parachlamydia sp.]
MTDPEELNDKIERYTQELIKLSGGSPDSFESDLVSQLIHNSLKMLSEGHDIGQLKLISRAMKEMRYAYRIFNQYGGSRRISIFGSARTPEEHPDYKLAKDFSRLMEDAGWMCITGAANGIMKAGHEGSRKES